ncbi:MAG: hypothetical protein KDI56_16020 [Xanthomonadales bacterium]|nr:hypothetical protein [Xanthomonadales bacterium]
MSFFRTAIVSITLFVSALGGASSALAAGGWELQSAPLGRAVALSPAAVNAHALSLQQTPPAVGARWSIPLPEGWTDWRTTSVSYQDDGGFRWQGKALDNDAHQAVLVSHRGALSGVIWTRHGHYEVASDAEGSLLLTLDDSLYPGCAGGDGEDATHLHSPVTSAATSPAPTTGSGQQIDVLIVYTSQARDAAGGEAQIEAVSQAAVDAANLAFDNSQVLAHLNLVGTRLTSRSDSGNSSTDLSWLSSDATVAQWRDELGADMVALIADDIGNTCGKGYVMRNVGSAFSASAFQVTARSCAVGNLSYAHEHGHNLGLEHDPANGTTASGASYPWSFGHVVDGNYRTLMSYSTECTSGCTRLPYFSNPNVNVNGQPSGIANQRDNARTLNSVVATVAAFRDSVQAELFADGFE